MAPRIGILAASFLCLGSIAQEAEAALLVEFREVSGDTILDYSGTLNFSGLSFTTGTIDSPSIGTSILAGGNPGVRNNVVGTNRRYLRPWLSAPDFTAGTRFPNAGRPPFAQQFTFLTATVLLSTDDFRGDVWSGSGTTTFAGIALEDLVNVDNPVIWRLDTPGRDQVRWQLAGATTIPESSSVTGLGMLAMLGLGFRHKLNGMNKE
ncbi:MAG: hypothetical protein AAGG02_12115 [Cyanobacteria bacterium P01_H01_bin.15]